MSTIPSFKGNEVTGIKRDEWMLPPSQRSGTDDSGRASPNFEVDFFSSLGRVKEQPERLQEKAKASTDAATGKLRPSEREINLQFKAGKALDEYDTPAPGTISEAKEFGSPGYQWRMMKLRRVHERATNEGRPLEDVALEQYNGLAAFEQAQAEQRWLQNGKGTSLHNSLPSSEGATTGIMLHDMPSSARTNRPSNGLQRPGPFRKPGSSSLLSSRTSTPVLSPAPVALQREQSSSSQASSQDHPQAHTPIPSVLDPIAVSTSASGQQPGEKFSRISPTELNKLRAKVMKAEMMKKPDAVKLRAEYDAACIASEPAGANEGGDKGDGFFSLNRQGHMQEVNENEDHPDQMTELRVLPTLDGQGRLYDVGPPNVSQEGGQSLPGNRRKKAKDVSGSIFSLCLTTLTPWCVSSYCLSGIPRQARLYRTAPRKETKRWLIWFALKCSLVDLMKERTQCWPEVSPVIRRSVPMQSIWMIMSTVSQHGERRARCSSVTLPSRTFPGLKRR